MGREIVARCGARPRAPSASPAPRRPALPAARGASPPARPRSTSAPITSCGVERGQPAHQVLQLAHVARPAIALAAAPSPPASSVLSGSPSPRRRARKWRDQRRNVVEPLAQRRQADRHDVEAVEQILAEQALADQLAQVAVGGGDDADIGADRRAPADRGELALLQHAQQPGLRLERHVADLVEEQRAALRPARSARPRAGSAPVKAPRSWPNSSLSISSRGIAAMLMATNGPAAALAVIVQRARHQLLAGAAIRR